MILDRLESWNLYFREGTRIARGFEFLQNEYDPSFPDGRLDIDGDNIFALVQGYDTRPMGQCRFEAHRRYLDIQYIVEGAEIMGWAAREHMIVDEDYDEEKDVEFYEQPLRFTSLEVHRGQFAFFHPGDAHEPGIRLGETNAVRKVVVKVLLE